MLKKMSLDQVGHKFLKSAFWVCSTKTKKNKARMPWKKFGQDNHGWLVGDESVAMQS